MTDYVIHFVPGSAYTSVDQQTEYDFIYEPTTLIFKTIRNVTTWEVRDGWALFWCGPALSTPAFMFPGRNVSRIEILESKGN